jgi:hypothetical protein
VFADGNVTKKLLSIFAQVLAVLFAIYGVFPIVAATQLAEDPLWFQVVVGLGGLSAIACGVAGFWFAATWYRRLVSPPDEQTMEPIAKRPAG